MTELQLTYIKTEEGSLRDGAKHKNEKHKSKNHLFFINLGTWTMQWNIRSAMTSCEYTASENWRWQWFLLTKKSNFWAVNVGLRMKLNDMELRVIAVFRECSSVTLKVWKWSIEWQLIEKTTELMLNTSVYERVNDRKSKMKFLTETDMGFWSPCWVEFDEFRRIVLESYLNMTKQCCRML